MTTKKHSLLDRKVLKDDLNDPMALLHPKNINKDMLLEYIRDACDYCTDYQVTVHRVKPINRTPCSVMIEVDNFSCRTWTLLSTITGSQTWPCLTSPQCSLLASPLMFTKRISVSCCLGW